MCVFAPQLTGPDSWRLVQMNLRNRYATSFQAAHVNRLWQEYMGARRGPQRCPSYRGRKLAFGNVLNALQEKEWT